MRMKSAFDVWGNIALVKFNNEGSRTPTGADKKKFAEFLLKNNKSIKTILEKIGKFKGRLRKQTTKWIAGEKTKEVLYRENGCVFRFNIDDTYFSPRLSSERLEIARKIKKGDEVLVMFAGVGPYPIVIAKSSKAAAVYSNEINRKANKYAEKNIELNKLKGRVVLLQGDVKRVAKSLAEGSRPTPNFARVINSKSFPLPRSRSPTLKENTSIPKKFNVIVMPRPRLKDSFLKEAFSLSKKGTRIFYYDFCKDEEVPVILDKIRAEAKSARKKVKILSWKHAGEIAPYKFRIRIDLKIV
ncbi:MAG: hypothetical protein KJ879_02485 [Nanoarchaeota archaeon]|nr:hypothetical protein [Nanoarchaeota archaeon]